MSDENTGRDLVPRPDEPSSAVTPRESTVPTSAAEAEVRFSAGEQAHTVGLTEARATQIVKQSVNARMIAFLIERGCVRVDGPSAAGSGSVPVAVVES